VHVKICNTVSDAHVERSVTKLAIFKHLTLLLKPIESKYLNTMHTNNKKNTSGYVICISLQ